MSYLDHIPQEYVKHCNSSEMMVTLKNGSVYCVMGIDGKNAARARGMNPTDVILSEYAFMDPESWRTIEPRVLGNKGTAMFISTPNGQNHFYEMFNIARNDRRNYFSSFLTIEDTQTISKEEIEQLRKEGVPEDFIQQEYYCFPEGQFVMTSTGMIDIKEIKPGMLVISHSGRLRKVLETYEKDYEGDLIRIKSYGSGEDLLCTPNHPIRIYERHAQTFRWIQAEHIKEKYRLFFPKMHFKGSYLTLEFIKLLAWYICEGSSGLNHLQMTVADREEADYVSKICKDASYESTVRENETALNVIINDVQLVDMLKELCGNDASTKKIPLHLLGDHYEVFFYELMKGDGCTHQNLGTKRISFVTVSKTLAYQVQLLAHSLHLTAGISCRDAHKGVICGRKVNCKKSYQVQIGSVEIRQESTTLIRGRYGIGACVREISRESFSGKVYNFKVQFDESYLVNGRAVHNCSFKRGAEGAYYGKQIQKARDDGRIGYLPINPDLPVHSSWDIGIGDSTSIWLFQTLRNGCINFVHYYENHNEGLEHYTKYLNNWKTEKDIQWGTHFVPHDMGNREFTSGVDRMETARSFGYHMTIVPRKPLEEGIQAVRSLLPLCSFDETNCRWGIKCLDFYRKKYNDILKVYYSEPCHDKWSHGSDAFRMAAVGIRAIGTDFNSSLEGDMKALQRYFGG